MKSKLPVALVLLVLGAGAAKAGFCENAAAATAAAGTLLMTASASAQATLAATSTAILPQATAGWIASVVGPGGTGYIAGTAGTVSGAVVGVVSSPVVLTIGAAAAVGGGATYLYCSM